MLFGTRSGPVDDPKNLVRKERLKKRSFFVLVQETLSRDNVKAKIYHPTTGRAIASIESITLVGFRLTLHKN